ncbi:M20/M25/M40 family metallo-hydrolase [Bacillaceae bacterium SIJ1]|uniref:M20/M25/M40 family metallo-hydrolase n=1 Tax=Litoribacterium kuwaitense TaxID=1398745 RepID=UPI0013EA403F|nr:M20/M25/M40 family metallo-hydrolase [Litoribacterium kuwaitense]NGP43631.1 M20/M25/M40 family metallo-hydrolase [Litoribacterium kuwaitense]
MVNEERLINEFIELVHIDSETKQERHIADALIKKCEQLGFTVEEDQTAAITGHEAGNLICTLKGSVHGPGIFFTAHMDTVAPGQGIRPQLKDGWLTSDGTTVLGADDKAGVAAMLEAMKVIQEEGLSHPDIQLIITAGEESGLVGSKAMKKEQIAASLGFAFDSDGQVGTIVTAAPSQYKLNMTVQGKSAHAGVAPEKGVSAITIAAKAIAKMRLGRIDEETTANIGRFAGGQATNVVCEHVDLLAEARSLTEEKVVAQVKHMTDVLEETAQRMGGSASVEAWQAYPSFLHTEESPVVQQAMKAVRSINRTPRLVQSGGGSDANVFSGLGVPTVNLGIGYENIHTTNERIAVEEIVKAAELVIAIATQAGSESVAK